MFQINYVVRLYIFCTRVAKENMDFGASVIKLGIILRQVSKTGAIRVRNCFTLEVSLESGCSRQEQRCSSGSVASPRAGLGPRTREPVFNWHGWPCRPALSDADTKLTSVIVLVMLARPGNTRTGPSLFQLKVAVCVAGDEDEDRALRKLHQLLHLSRSEGSVLRMVLSGEAVSTDRALFH